MTLIIEPNNDHDYQLFVQLAKRLNVKFREEGRTSSLSESEFFSLAGALETPESGEQLLAIIESHRNSKDLDFTI